MDIDTSSSLSIKFDNSKDISSEFSEPSFDIHRSFKSATKSFNYNEEYDEKIERVDQVKERGIFDILSEIEKQRNKELNSYTAVEEESKNFIDPSLLTTVHECLIWKVNWLTTVEDIIDKSGFCANQKIYSYTDVINNINESKINVVGIVKSIQKSKIDKNHESIKVCLESPVDKNTIDLYYVHSERIDPNRIFKKDRVLLIQNATRKLSKKLDIYLYLSHLDMKECNIKWIGNAKPDNYRHKSRDLSYCNLLISDINSNQIVRHILRLSVMIIDTIYLSIKLVCSKCGKLLNEEDLAASCEIKEDLNLEVEACNHKNSMLSIKCATIIQDGTAKAYMFFQDTVFNINFYN